MNKIALLLTATFIIAIHATSQITVQIGNGTVMNNTLYSPVFRSTATSTVVTVRSNILFTQAELTTAGITAGNIITSLQFNKLNTNYFTVPVTYTMYMGNTSKTTLLTGMAWSDIMNTHTQVFTSTNFNVPDTAGWVNINITPFVYTGGSLEIATDLIMTGNGGATGPIIWEYTAETAADMITGATSSSTTPPATLSGTTSTYKHRPNIKISYISSALPLRLTRFEGTSFNHKNRIFWTTANEDQVCCFELERRTNLSNWQTAGILKAEKGKHNYSFDDMEMPSELTYYRLKCIDEDGKYTYSKTISVSNYFKERLLVFPNPSKGDVSMRFYVGSPGIYTLRCFDMQGKPVMVKTKYADAKGWHIFNMEQLVFKHGYYMVELSKDGSVIVVQQFLHL